MRNADDRPAVLIAGGIGITPIYAMAQVLVEQGRAVELQYAARSPSEAALVQPLRALLGEAMKFYPSDAGIKLDVTSIVANAAADSVFYVCGPASLIEAVGTAARDNGISPDRIRTERFAAELVQGAKQPVRVTLRRSAKVIEVGNTRRCWTLCWRRA